METLLQAQGEELEKKIYEVIKGGSTKVLESQGSSESLMAHEEVARTIQK